MAFPRGVMGLSAVCDCGIAYHLLFLARYLTKFRFVPTFFTLREAMRIEHVPRWLAMGLSIGAISVTSVDGALCNCCTTLFSSEF